MYRPGFILLYFLLVCIPNISAQKKASPEKDTAADTWNSTLLAG